MNREMLENIIDANMDTAEILPQEAKEIADIVVQRNTIINLYELVTYGFVYGYFRGRCSVDTNKGVFKSILQKLIRR